MHREVGFNLIFLIGLMSLGLVILSYTVKVDYKNTEADYNYALTAATTDATRLIRESKKESSVNYGYDEIDDIQDIPIDYDKVLERFYNTLWYNLGIYGDIDKQNAFKQHITLKGIVGYNSIHLATFDDKWLAPIPFSSYSSSNNLVINYTLGKQLWYYNTQTGATGIDLISNLASPKPGMTHEQWKQYVIMEKINQAFTTFTSSDLSLEAFNNKEGVQFILPHADNRFDNVISSPGMFAMIDNVKIGISNKNLRFISFGGAQLVERK